MGYRAGLGTHRIYLKDFDGSENWVDIRASRTYGQRLRTASAAVRVQMPTQPGEQSRAEVDLYGLRIGLLEQSIVAWSLKADDADPEPMPLTRESFASLDEALGEWLAEQIESYYDSRLEAVRNPNLGGPSRGPSTSAANSHTSSP